MNLTPVPKHETNSRRFRTKSGWITLSPRQSLDSLKTFLFPLYSPEIYTIGEDSIKNDLVLPLEDESVQLIIRVHSPNTRPKAGKCSCGKLNFYFKIDIQNVSYSTRPEIVTVNDQVLNSNEILMVDFTFQTHIELRFGPYEYFMCKEKAPNYEFLSKFTSHVFCPVCSNLWSDPRPLPCGHICCKSCLEDLTDIASERLESHLRRESFNETDLQRLSKIYCPKCEFAIALPDVPKIHSNPILSSFGTYLISLYQNDELYCADCDNVRCLTNKNDFWKCRTCECLCCPLCAVDLHRFHEIKSIYWIMIEFYVAYSIKKCLVVKEYAGLSDATIGEIDKMRNVLEFFKNQVEKARKLINTNLMQGKLQYNRIQHFERFVGGREVENERTESLQLFQAMVLTIQECVQTVTKYFNAKSDIISQAGVRFGCNNDNSVLRCGSLGNNVTLQLHPDRNVVLYW